MTGRGITIGATLEEVVGAYQIKDGYALWKVSRDGAAAPTIFAYEKGQLSEAGLIRGTLIVAYYRMEGQWYPLTVGETKQYLSFQAGKTAEKPYSTILLFQFEFPFNGSSDLIMDKTLGGYSVNLESDE